MAWMSHEDASSHNYTLKSPRVVGPTRFPLLTISSALLSGQSFLAILPATQSLA